MKRILTVIFSIGLIITGGHTLWAQGCDTPSEDGKPQVMGYLQPEFSYYLFGQDNNGNAVKPSTFYFRRARVGVMGTIPYDVSYYVMLELSPIYKGGYPFLLDAFVSYAPFGKYLKFSFGQFKSPFGMELNTPCYALYTVNRSLVSEQLASPYRELQFMVLGAFGKERDVVSYRLSVLNGTGLGKSDAYNVPGGNNSKDLAGRVVVAPVEFLKIGAGFRYGLWGKKDANGDVKSRTRYGADVSFEKWNLVVQGEYLWGKDVGEIAGGGGCGGKKSATAGYPQYNKSGYIFQALYMTPWQLQPVVKYEYYDPDGTDYKFLEESQNFPQSTVTFGFNYFINEWTRIQVNYLYNAEKQTNGQINEFKNDQFIIQVQAKF